MLNYKFYIKVFFSNFLLFKSSSCQGNQHSVDSYVQHFYKTGVEGKAINFQMRI